MSKLELKKIWDPLTRFWHWLLAMAVVTNWVFGEFMSFDTVTWHFYLGYAALGLVGFRFLWGFIGPEPVRWSRLFPRPVTVMKYLATIGKREPSGTHGHNPLGSLSVIALLIVLLAQAGTGLFIETDDFFESGPLYGYVSDATISSLTWWHHFLSKVLLALVILHLVAILFYRIWKRENLVMPMITGWKWVRQKPED